MKCVNYQKNHVTLLILLIFCFSLSLCDNLSKSPDSGVKQSGISDQKPNITSLINNNSNNNNTNNNNNNNKTNINDNTDHDNQKSPVKIFESQKPDSDKNKTNNSTSVVNKKNDQNNKQTADNNEGLNGHTPSLNSGAIKRAFYVFVGLSVLSVAYLLFRSTRLRQSPAQMVRKYGVLAHKQDIEMRPLPLDEDDEDDTVVFDATGYTKKIQSTSKDF